MKTIREIAPILLAVCILNAAHAWAQESSASSSATLPSRETTLKDQTNVSVTVYNNNLALVRDRRKLTLESGEQKLAFMDVAQLIQPQTVSLESVSSSGSLRIIEQNYEFDLISPNKLMEKFVGKQIELINFSKDIGFESEVAELLSINESPIYKVNGQIYLGHPGYVVLPEVPENLIAKPSLIWLVDNALPDQEVEVTYLTNGVTWAADYIVKLAKDDKSLGLSGWVTLNNQAGATFTNAELKLVAGDVNVVPTSGDGGFGGGGAKWNMQLGIAIDRPQQESFAEYHLYTMPRRTTIKQNQSKQLALLAAENVVCAKKYEYRGQLHFYFDQMAPIKDEHVGVYLEFQNEEKNALGIPLPGGVMRIYQEDSQGALQFAGEDRINHTPKDEKVSLHMGKAFDIIGERVQSDFQRIADNVTESAFEIVIRNHKDTDVMVDIVEPMTDDWTMLQQSQPHMKKDARTAVFTVPVAKDGEATVTYRVRVVQ